MSGVKGQTWKTNRPVVRVKVNSALKEDLYKNLERMAKERRWSKSSTIEYIIEQYFKIGQHIIE